MCHGTQDTEHAASRIAVVGAGISGLAAARLLTDHGIPVQVFDKGRGVGGRTSVRERGGFCFDHGAQYFTVQDDRFRTQVASWLDAGIVAEWHAAIALLGRSEVAPNSSPKRYVGVPSMNAMALHLAASIDVHSSVHVAQINWADHGWHLHDDQGRQLGLFEALIVAIPPAQAAGLLTDCPDLARSATSTTLAPCWAVMLAFDRRLDVPFAGAFVHQSPLSWVARNNSKPGRPSCECWVLHATPEWSAEHLEDPAEGVCEELSGAFFGVLDITPLRPVRAQAHRWRYARPVHDTHHGCLWSEPARVAVCGDWCVAGSVEGAFLSGLAAAERLLPGHIHNTGVD